MSAPFAKQGFDFVHLLGKFGIQGIAHVHALLIQLLLKLADSGFYTFISFHIKGPSKLQQRVTEVKTRK